MAAGLWNGPITLFSSDNNGGSFQFGAGSTLSSSPLVLNGNITGVNIAATTYQCSFAMPALAASAMARSMAW